MRPALLALQAAIAAFVLYSTWGQSGSNALSEGVLAVIDFAKAGMRSASDPFIGRLNNQRVRKALQGALAGFLDTMVSDEALIDYALEVTASRDDEVAGQAIVNALLRPTFSIDFILITLNLE